MTRSTSLNELEPISFPTWNKFSSKIRLILSRCFHLPNCDEFLTIMENWQPLTIFGKGLKNNFRYIYHYVLIYFIWHVLRNLTINQNEWDKNELMNNKTQLPWKLLNTLPFKSDQYFDVKPPLDWNLNFEPTHYLHILPNLVTENVSYVEPKTTGKNLIATCFRLTIPSKSFEFKGFFPKAQSTLNNGENKVFLIDWSFKWTLGRASSALVFDWGSGDRAKFPS